MGIRVLLADDHRLLREGLGALLAKEHDIELVGQAGDGLACVSLALELRPNVIVMDLTMPNLNGIEATRRILAKLPEVKVLCLSFHAEQHIVSSAIDAGAAGYLLKDCASDELVRAIRILMANHIYLSPAIASVLVSDYRRKAAGTEGSAFARLTGREREIVQLLAEGYTTKEIAFRLSISVKTVGTHREHIMAKLQARSIAELTRHAIREGFI